MPYRSGLKPAPASLTLCVPGLTLRITYPSGRLVLVAVASVGSSCLGCASTGHLPFCPPCFLLSHFQEPSPGSCASETQPVQICLALFHMSWAPSSGKHFPEDSCGSPNSILLSSEQPPAPCAQKACCLSPVDSLSAVRHCACSFRKPPLGLADHPFTSLS